MKKSIFLKGVIFLQDGIFGLIFAENIPVENYWMSAAPTGIFSEKLKNILKHTALIYQNML